MLHFAALFMPSRDVCGTQTSDDVSNIICTLAEEYVMYIPSDSCLVGNTLVSVCG